MLSRIASTGSVVLGVNLTASATTWDVVPSVRTNTLPVVPASNANVPSNSHRPPGVVWSIITVSVPPAWMMSAGAFVA